MFLEILSKCVVIMPWAAAFSVLSKMCHNSLLPWAAAFYLLWYRWVILTYYLLWELWPLSFNVLDKKLQAVNARVVTACLIDLGLSCKSQKTTFGRSNNPPIICLFVTPLMDKRWFLMFSLTMYFSIVIQTIILRLHRLMTSRPRRN